jgi:hypothetical protein
LRVWQQHGVVESIAEQSADKENAQAVGGQLLAVCKI